MEEWRDRFRRLLGLEASLSAEAVNDLIAKISGLLDHVQQLTRGRLASQADLVESIGEEFSQLRTKVTGPHGQVDPTSWKARPESERREDGIALRSVFLKLRCLNQDELWSGKCHFVIFTVILVSLSTAYIVLHWGLRSETVNADTVIDTGNHLHTVVLDISGLRGINSGRDSEGTLDSEHLAKVSAALKTLRETANKFELSTGVLQLLGRLEASVEHREVKEAEKLALDLSRKLSGEVECSRSGFLWCDRTGQWVEIALWAELGTLVGLVFYIAGSLSKGRFEVAETAMLWTEAAIAPLVVLAIFFLFGLIGFTELSPLETSVTQKAGLAFILGFTIRRTLGLLDIVKKRIFPDPSPAS